MGERNCENPCQPREGREVKQSLRIQEITKN
jgi:hypothetical protein